MKTLLALLTLALLVACRSTSPAQSSSDAPAHEKLEVRYYMIGDA